MFREWAPLEHVLSRVPPIGRLGQEQDVTCLAACPGYLAAELCSGMIEKETLYRGLNAGRLLGSLACSWWRP